jgi:hypothetical protein
MACSIGVMGWRREGDVDVGKEELYMGYEDEVVE